MNLEKLPGFDSSENTQESLVQLGEIESSASSTGSNQADLEVESEAGIDAEGHVRGISLDLKLQAGDIVMSMCVWPNL